MHEELWKSQGDSSIAVAFQVDSLQQGMIENSRAPIEVRLFDSGVALCHKHESRNDAVGPVYQSQFLSLSAVRMSWVTSSSSSALLSTSVRAA